MVLDDAIPTLTVHWFMHIELLWLKISNNNNLEMEKKFSPSILYTLLSHRKFFTTQRGV